MAKGDFVEVKEYSIELYHSTRFRVVCTVHVSEHQSQSTTVRIFSSRALAEAFIDVLQRFDELDNYPVEGVEVSLTISPEWLAERTNDG